MANASSKEHRHPESLEDVTKHILEEARMLMPGIQALFGFQLIAVFNSTFSDKLTKPQQIVHLAAIGLVALAAAAVLAPAAYHRQAEPWCVSRRFVRIGTFLLTAALPPLVAGICLDFYLISWMVLGNTPASIALAGVLGACFLGLWFAFPNVSGWRARRARQH